MDGSLPLVLSVGSVNIDITARVERLPSAGETVHAGAYAIGLGGKGANQAAAAARIGSGFGVRAALAGRVGADAFGAQTRELLGAFPVDLGALRDDPQDATGIALIDIDAAGENCITVVGGANMRVDESDIRAAGGLFAESRVVLLQLEIPMPAVLAAARRARESGARVILDPAPAPRRPLPEALWPLVDIITPNETEAAILTDIFPETPEDAGRAAASLIARGARAAVIKMGARGAYWHEGAQGGFVPPFAVKAVDTVAAGDCFNAALAAALAREKPLAEAVRIAAAAGALAVTKPGAADSAPTWDEILSLL